MIRYRFGRIGKWIALAALLLSCLALPSCSGKSPKESEQPQASGKSGGGSGTESGQSGGQSQEEEGEPHEYIKEAKTMKIELIDAAKLDVTDVAFLDSQTIAIVCPKDIGVSKCFLYNMETKQTVKLPDNVNVIKKLDDGDLFVRTGSEGSYAILDGAAFTVKKALTRPQNADTSLDISPDGKAVAYITNEGLFVSDPDFKVAAKLVAAKQDADEFKTEMPRYPLWLDSTRISYRYLAWETVKYCGVVLRDGSENTVYENARDSAIYPLISGDYISRGEYGKGVGLIDGISGEKKIITKATIEYEGFAYDKNGKWVAFFRTNPEVTEESKWTGRLDVYSIAKGEKLNEFKSEKPNTMPIEDAAASPDGKSLLFTDLDKTGRRVLYKLEIKTEEQSESGSQSSSGGK